MGVQRTTEVACDVQRAADAMDLHQRRAAVDDWAVVRQLHWLVACLGQSVCCLPPAAVAHAAGHVPDPTTLVAVVHAQQHTAAGEKPLVRLHGSAVLLLASQLQWWFLHSNGRQQAGTEPVELVELCMQY